MHNWHTSVLCVVDSTTASCWHTTESTNVTCNTQQTKLVVVYLRSRLVPPASLLFKIHASVMCYVSSSLPGQSATPTMLSLLMTKIVDASVPRCTSKSPPKFPTRLTSWRLCPRCVFVCVSVCMCVCVCPCVCMHVYLWVWFSLKAHKLKSHFSST